MTNRESVVHPISPEHPLVPGDHVFSSGEGHGKAEQLFTVASIRAGSEVWNAWADSGEPLNRGANDCVARISHAPTPEPAHDGEYSLTPEQEAECDRIARERAEEADRVNPRLMQATDEQIEAEVARRANLPHPQAEAKLERVRTWFLALSACGRDFGNGDLNHLISLARAAERELIKQEGGSHE
jgi:hypothetical protein